MVFRRFTKKKSTVGKFHKRKRFVKRRFPVKRRLFTRKLGVKRRMFSRKGSRSMNKIRTPNVPMSIVPRLAERCHVKFITKMQMPLQWDSTSDIFVGQLINPVELGQNPASSQSPWNTGWGAGGSHLIGFRTFTTVPGLFSLGSQYLGFYTTHVTIQYKFTRQDQDDANTISIGCCPLSATQAGKLIQQSTTPSPSADHSYWFPPVVGVAPTATASWMAFQQMPYRKMAKFASVFGGGKATAVLRQSFAVKKFMNPGFPYLAAYQGVPPTALAPSGTSPAIGMGHYLCMFNDGGNPSSVGPTSTEQFDVETTLIQHCTFFNPTMQDLSLTVTDPVPRYEPPATDAVDAADAMSLDSLAVEEKVPVETKSTGWFG